MYSFVFVRGYFRGLKMRIRFVLNGKEYIKGVNPTQTLLDFLRNEMKLTGTKKGCEIGECGACTVLLDGKAVNSCLVLVGQINTREITTIEGIGSSDNLHPVQKAFIESGAVQCGFCTPGMIMSIIGLLNENPHPSEDEIKMAIEGNLCRCTGYEQILQAIRSVIKPRTNTNRHEQCS